MSQLVHLWDTVYKKLFFYVETSFMQNCNNYKDLANTNQDVILDYDTTKMSYLKPHKVTHIK